MTHQKTKTMSTNLQWNLRMVEVQDGAEVVLMLSEVFYNEDGKPFLHCRAKICGATLVDVDFILACARAATKKPVLRPSDFVSAP